MKLLSAIQDGLRVTGRKRNENIISGDGLLLARRMYRALVAAFPWPERRITTPLAETTTAKTGTYEWPITPRYVDVRAFEMQDGNDQNRWKRIPPVASERIWNNQGNVPSQVMPLSHLLFQDVDTLKVELRPAPSLTGQSMRVVGIAEPPTLVNGNSKTIFRTETGDDVFELLLAAETLSVDGFDQFAGQRLGQATGLLQTLFGKDRVPAEAVAQLVPSLSGA